jgi:hypothetical protein
MSPRSDDDILHDGTRFREIDTMQRLVIIVFACGLSACASNLEANEQCVRLGGCVSSFPNSGYGPLHAQAVGPLAPPQWQPPQ